MYIWLRAFLLTVNFIFLIIPRTLEDELIMLLICSCHLPSLLSVSPKCLWWLTNVTFVLLKTNEGLGIFFLSVNRIASVLFGLKSTNHCFDQSEITHKSWFKIPSMSEMFDAVNASDVSSANIRVVVRT